MRGRVQPDASAGALDQLLHDGQPGPRSAAKLVAAVQAAKHLEYLAVVPLVDADAVVAHEEHDVRRSAMRTPILGGVVCDHRTHLDSAQRLVVVLEGVANQVD